MHLRHMSQQGLLALPFLSRWPGARLGLVIAGFLVLSLALFATVGLALAHAPSPGPHPNAERLTQDLVALNAHYHLADPTTRAQLLDTLLTLAAERQELLAALIETDPGEVLRLALPAGQRQSLPPAVQALVEEAVELEGVLEVLHEDHDTGSRYLHFLEADGQRFALHFAAAPPTLPTGTRVRVRGVQVGGALALASDGSVEALAAVLPNTFGAQKTLVMLVTFQDNPTQPYTVDNARGVFATSSNFDLENSYGQTWLTGVVDSGQAADVRGWYTIAQNSTVCDYSMTATLAEQAATAAGVNLSAYSRRIYAFPSNACTWWGLGTVGGNPSKAWINGSLQLRVVGHEMGHNFGLYHSHSLSCATSGCSASEYGDAWDDMGAAVGHYNAFQKELLGWLNAGASPLITTVTAEGTYGLEPYEPDSFNSKALKILKSTDPATLKNTYYYVEYRTSFGFDSAVASGLLVHTGSESSANSSYLWDLAPSTTTSDWVLDVSQSYTDATAGVTLTTLSASSTGATVQVTFGVAPCAGADPTVALAPAGTQYSAAGATVSYTVTVTDNDSAQCAAATFALQATVPAGWTATWASATLTLSPGASAVTTLTLTSAPTANGLYTVPVTAANDSYVGATAAVVSVSPPCVAANPTVALSPTSQWTVPGGAVYPTVTVTDNDSASCPVTTFTLQATVPAGWTAAFASTTLPLSPGASGVTTLTVTSPSSATAGLYTIAVTAANSGTPTYAALASVTAEVVTSLTVSVETNKASYTPGQSVTMTAVVYVNGSPATNAIVTFAVTKPDGAVVQKTATTDSTGTTAYKLRLKQTDPLGTYQVTTYAAAYGISGSATASFMVQ